MATESSNKLIIDKVEEILAAVKQGKHETDRDSRLDLLRKVDGLRYQLENPLDTINRHWENMTLAAALRLLNRLGILEKIPSNGSITSKELADAVGLDESVITRSMRLIIVQGIAEEVQSNTYAHNEKSIALSSGFTHSFFTLCFEHDFTYRSLPEYFKSHTKEDFFDPLKTPYAFARNKEGMSFYQILSEDPEILSLFNNAMAQAEKSWPVLGMFPFASLKAQVEAEPHRPFIVDVGGGKGQSLLAIQKEAPAGFGAQMILQDRPVVLDSIPQEEIPHITKMAHDFFTPQPVRDAHLYLIRRCLHNYYEPQSIQILKGIASAMGPTSRLLISEYLVPDRVKVGDDPSVYWMDFVMMMLHGQEKSECDFRRLLNEAGLELVKAWYYPGTTYCVVEAKLKGV